MANTITSPVAPQIPQLRKQDYPDGLGTQDGLEKFFTLLNPFFSSLGNALSGSLSIGNLNGEIISFQIAVPTTPWTPLQFQGTWGNSSPNNPGYPTASYLVDNNSRVWLTGLVGSQGATITPGNAAIVASVPSTVAPNNPGVSSAYPFGGPAFAAIGSWGTAVGVFQIVVTQAGNITVTAVATGTALAAPQTVANLNLDGISFPSVGMQPGVPSCFPKQVRLVGSSQPVDIWLTSVADANSWTAGQLTTPTVALGGLSWSRVNSNSGTNLVQINYIPGLTPGRTYNCRAWVLYSGGSGAANAGVGQAQASAAGSNG